MENTTFNSLSYSALSEEPNEITEILKKYASKDILRILDLGCGTGNNLLHITNLFPNAELIGVDISAMNIQTAQLKKEKLNLGHSIQFHACDYLNLSIKSFDIMYADSVLHLISAHDEILYQKISQDLNLNGLFIATIPDDCFYNRVLILMRRVLKRCRSQFLDKMILRIAKFIYPSVDQKILMERVHYMYIIPKRMNSAAFRKKLKNNYHLTTIEIKRCKSTSIAKPKHSLIILQKN
jgi:trans-aconitate 2-methyltransferase